MGLLTRNQETTLTQRLAESGNQKALKAVLGAMLSLESTDLVCSKCGAIHSPSLYREGGNCQFCRGKLYWS